MKFYYAGKENPNIPKIGTCVMTTMDVNYAPNGFSAYEVPDEPTAAVGSTGMPVAIQLTLQFQEITYLTKDDFGTMDGSGQFVRERENRNSPNTTTGNNLLF